MPMRDPFPGMPDAIGGDHGCAAVRPGDALSWVPGVPAVYWSAVMTPTRCETSVRLRCSRSHAPAVPPRPKRRTCASCAEIRLQYRAHDLARLMRVRHRNWWSAAPE